MRVRAIIVAAILMMASSACAGPEMLLMAASSHNYQTSGFEASLSPWTATTSGGGIADQSNSYGHTSSWSARLAGYSSNGAYGYISQTVTTRGGYLDFWYLTPTDYTGLGAFTVSVDGSTAATLAYPGAVETWYHSTTDVSLSATSHVIQFKMSRVGATNVWMYIDDIKVPVP